MRNWPRRESGTLQHGLSFCGWQPIGLAAPPGALDIISSDFVNYIVHQQSLRQSSVFYTMQPVVSKGLERQRQASSSVSCYLPYVQIEVDKPNNSFCLRRYSVDVDLNLLCQRPSRSQQGVIRRQAQHLHVTGDVTRDPFQHGEAIPHNHWRRGSLSGT